MKKFIALIITILLLISNTVYAKEKTIYVNLEKFTYSSDSKTYEDIKTYESVEDFEEDYNSNNLPDIYITNFLYDGVDAVKTPDLDDFIEADSNDEKIKTLEINVVNINTTGNIEFTGETVGTMIAVNTNNVKGNINIILNNVSIDTDSKKAPAIYVYNKETTYTDCIVTIKTAANSKNYIEGGKLKKVSLLAKEDLDSYTSNYSADALTNYESYSSYYGIYSSDEIDDILFATVKADSEDLLDGDPLYFYKASGAISSDIDLYFEGEGYLKVTSKNKEGIETKGNLTFSGGTGDYVIEAMDDCLNTTTASSAGTDIHNDIVIDVHSMVAIVNDEGDEGDAIDSNGKLTINGGIIYAFAHSDSQDSGLDSETGIYLNGGTVLSTGNMSDAIASDSKQNYLYVNFNSKIEKDTIIVIKDQDDNIITALKTSKDITTLLYSDEDLEYDSLKVYTGGTIEGDESDGVYTKVDSYTGGEEISFTTVNNTFEMKETSNISSTLLKVLLIEVGAFVLLLAYIIIDNKLLTKKVTK